jgi:hypothetical protein
MRRGAAAGLIAGVLLALPGGASAQGLDTTCQFALTRLDASTTNVLAVDTNAVYWGGTYAGLPGTRIRIEGVFPHARYMSWNVYDSTAKPVDALSDVRLRPNPGGGTYTAFIEFGPRPEQPAPNTLYSGESRGGTFLYRVYVPDRGQDAKGGVPLPRVSLEPAGGRGNAPFLTPCRELQAPYAWQLNRLIEGGPAPPDPTADGKGYPGRGTPHWRLFTNLCASAVDVMLDNEDGERFHPQASGRCGDGPGFLSNRDIAYVYAPTSRGFGDVLSVRARAPRRGQLRYWSFCQYEPATQRVIACRRDDRVTVGRHGWFRLAVSTAQSRPRNARRDCGVTWLPWGPATQGLLIYRHMLPRRSFRHAIQRVGKPGNERRAMGRLYPRASYFKTAAEFERRGCGRR